jgi:predicted acetyltransferase
MRERGESISILYPFSFPFYERFGYDLVNHYTSYQATPADFALPQADPAVLVRAAKLPEDLALIKEVYRRLAPRWNTMLDRDKSHWNTEHEHNGSRWERWLDHMSADRKQVYLLETAAEKQVVGFFSIFDNPLTEGGFESTVSELMIEHDEHMDVLARFCRRLPANVKKVKLIAAPNPVLWRLFKEPTVTTQLHACYQARVVDVEKACRERGYADDVAGEVVFAISDGCASAWNSGPWHLRVSGGRGEIERYSGPRLDVLHLRIQHFSVIFTGYKRATDYATIYPRHAAELKIMDEFFYDRPTRLLDFF